MRLNGTLKNWNAERGFGVIAALQGGQQIFVHISAFPREKRDPVEGDALTFEIELDGKGRRRAAKIQLAEENWTLFADPHWPESKLDTLAGSPRSTNSRLRAELPPPTQGSNLPWVLLGTVAILSLGWLALNGYSSVLIKLVTKPAQAASQGAPAQPTHPPVEGAPVSGSSQSK